MSFETNTELVIQHSETKPNGRLFWRLVRRDLQTGQEHVLMPQWGTCTPRELITKGTRYAAKLEQEA